MSILAIVAVAALGYFLLKMVDFGKLPTISGGAVALAASLFSGDSIMSDMNSTQLIPKDKVVMENIRIERPENNIKAIQITTDLNNFSEYTVSKFSLRFIAYDCPLAPDGRSSGPGATPAEMLNDDMLTNGQLSAETLNEVSRTAEQNARENTDGDDIVASSPETPEELPQAELNAQARVEVTADNYRPLLYAVPREEIVTRSGCRELETLLVRSQHMIPPGQFAEVVDIVPFDHVIMTDGELIVGYDVVFVQASNHEGMIDAVSKLATELL